MLEKKKKRENEKYVGTKFKENEEYVGMKLKENWEWWNILEWN